MQKDVVIKTVDDFIALRTEVFRVRLEEMRQIILDNIPPESQEVLSYQIPCYKYKGMLVGFGNTKTHISFYVASRKVSSLLANEFKPYKPQTATISFELDKPFPIELIKKIIQLRMQENEEIEMLKQLKKAPDKAKK